MKSIAAYVRSLLGLSENDQATRTSFKRDRAQDDCSSDDDIPAFKRHKQLKPTIFPDIMSSNNSWDSNAKPRNVRYIPIQVEEGHPSTSTPIEVQGRYMNRVKPMKIVDITGNGPSTPSRKPRMHTPLRPVVHAVIDDDDDDDEVTWIETKAEPKQVRKVFVDDEDEENTNDQRDDVIFVKKVSTPPPLQPYKYFISKQRDEPDTRDREPVQYYRLSKKSNDVYNWDSVSPKTSSKFKAPAGITKTYRKAPTTVPRWMQPQKSNLQSRNRFLNLTGNARTTLSEVFNLDEKRNYQELIRRVAGTTRPLNISKAEEFINLVEDSSSLRNTQRAQKKALDDIKLVEKGIKADREGEATKEYDPITVASINSSDSEVEVVLSETSSSSVRIDPINSLRDSYRDRAVTSTDWLSKVDSKYRKKKQEQQDKIKDVRRESDIISKLNDELKHAHLEHKLKHELSIPESLIEESAPTVELPELTPEQEKLVNRALGPGPPGQVLVEKFNLRITRRDLQTLSGLNWLNDEVINFYMNLLMQRSEERKDLPKVYATNTFFYPKLMQSGQAGLRRWTRKVDIFSHDLMVLPVHLGVHWCLSYVDFRNKKVNYLDSMGGRNQACLEAVMQYLRDEHKDKKGAPFDDSGWKTECLKDIPQQMNGSDCGMFSCTFAEFTSRDAKYTFSQQHMPYLRRKAALEILQGKLLL